MNNATKGVLGVLVVLIPSAFNYLSARGDSSEAKIRAEVAYSMTVESVKDLEETVHGLELDVARLQAQAQERASMRAIDARASVPKAPEAVSLPPPPLVEHTHSNRMMKAAPAFEDAVQSYKAMKK